jgi:uncharacterized protein (DUF58 family)
MIDTAKHFQPDILSKIARLELRASQVVEGFVSGMHKSPYKGFSVEFANHRLYTPGDDIRHIDWRVFGKSDRFFIKEYEGETNLRVHVVLDCSGSMAYPEHPGTPRMTKWTYASTVAASLAYLLVLQQDGVGLTLFDRDIREQLPVSSNRPTLAAIAAMIERNAPREETDVGATIAHLAERIHRRSMVVIISDLLMDTDRLMDGLHRLRHGRHEVLVLHVLDQDELEFPFADRTMFEGMEDADVEILTDPQSLRSSYLEALNTFISKVRGACLNRRIDYELLSTATPLDVALSKFLATRMHRQRRV